MLSLDTYSPACRKINFVLEVLGLSYEQVNLDFQKNEHKGPEFLKINPNGRIPALVDHDNNDFTIWCAHLTVVTHLGLLSNEFCRESNAITQYLVDRYDKERKISVAPGTEEYYTQLQWLYFQASGQGPYYGQAGWFLLYSPEKIPSAIERYRNEIRRVLGVLESVLSNREWLVGDKATVADISFIPYVCLDCRAPRRTY